MKEYRCGCGSTDIRSVEIITMTYPVHPNEDNEPEFDGSNGKTLFSEIDSIRCLVCDAEYALDELETIIVDSEEDDAKEVAEAMKEFAELMKG